MPIFSLLIFYGRVPGRTEGNLSFELEYVAETLQELAARDGIANLGKLLLGNGPFEVNGGLVVEVTTKDPVQLRNAVSHCAWVMDAYYTQRYDAYCAALEQRPYGETLPTPRRPILQLGGLDTNGVFDACLERLELAKSLAVLI